MPASRRSGCIPIARRAWWPTASRWAGSDNCIRARPPRARSRMRCWSARFISTGCTSCRCASRWRAKSRASSRCGAIFRWFWTRALPGKRSTARWPSCSIPELVEWRVREVFRDARLGQGEYSLLLGATFQAPDRTLREEELQELSGARGGGCWQGRRSSARVSKKFIRIGAILQAKWRNTRVSMRTAEAGMSELWDSVVEDYAQVESEQEPESQESEIQEPEMREPKCRRRNRTRKKRRPLSP